MRLSFLTVATKGIKLGAIAGSILLGLLLQRVEAVSIPIVNYSFEDPNVGAGYALGGPTGWSGTPGGSAFIENTASTGMSGGDGAQYLGLDNDGAHIYQDLGVPFAPNTKYTVDLAGAHRETFTHSTVEFGVYSTDAIGTDLGTAGFLDIQGVWDGSGNPDGDNVWNLFRDASFLETYKTGALGQTASFTTGAVAPTGNVTVFIRIPNYNGRVNIDNIRLDATPIPEPTSLLLLFGCGVAFAAIRRRS